MDYTALISGLVGALVGALASVATIYIQGLLQNRLETRRLLYETAYKDYEIRILHPGPNSPGVAAFPVILSYHQKMAALVESGKLTPNSAAEEMIGRYSAPSGCGYPPSTFSNLAVVKHLTPCPARSLSFDQSGKDRARARASGWASSGSLSARCRAARGRWEA